MESKLEDGQYSFHPGLGITNLHSKEKIFTLKQIFKKSWEYGKSLFTCFVAFDRVSWDKLCKVLREYGVDGQLSRAITSF